MHREWIREGARKAAGARAEGALPARSVPATIALEPEQAELIARRLSVRAEEDLEEALLAGLGVDALLEVWDGLVPCIATMRSLRLERTVRDHELVREVAAEALADYRDLIGHDTIVGHRMAAGEVVQWRVVEDESPSEAIRRRRSEVEKHVRGATTAMLVLEAVEAHELRVKAARGNLQAKASLATRRRWAEENRRLREGPAA